MSDKKIIYVLIMALICILTINGILYGIITEKTLIIETQYNTYNGKLASISTDVAKIEHTLDKTQQEYIESYNINKEYSELYEESLYYTYKSNEYIEQFNVLNHKHFVYIDDERTQTGEYRSFLDDEYNPFIEEYNTFTDEYNLYLGTYDVEYSIIEDKETEHIEKWFNYWN